MTISEISLLLFYCMIFFIYSFNIYHKFGITLEKKKISKFWRFNFWHSI